ncbi:MAG: hypothetical protein AAF211_00795 [Myxococcota bacterium]
MDPAVAIATTHDMLQRIVRAHPWLVAEPAVDSAVGRCRALAAMGAPSVFALGAADTEGAPSPSVAWASLDLATSGLLDTMHAGEAALDAVPDKVVEQIDAWDPERRARVVRAVFSDGAPVAHRATFGARPAAWAAFDDKTAIDELWDAVSIERAPRFVVPADAEALASAHTALDHGFGTVWAIDNREGWTGAALGTRWVHDAATLDAATAFARQRADQVRVMPFLEGIPCSIHGMVFPDHVLVLRPCELVTLRDPVRGRFVYGTASTLWDPPPADRAALRAVARRVGEHLRAAVDYRGTFTVDGVLTAQGFRPTELNPRFGAALGFIAQATPQVDLYLLHLTLIEGQSRWPPGLAAALEEGLVARADARRAGGSRIWLPGPDPMPDRDLSVLLDDGRWREARDGESRIARVRTYNLPSGPIFAVGFEAGAMEAGTPVAPLVAGVANWLNAPWALGLPELHAPRSASGR